jgi:serine protease Do
MSSATSRHERRSPVGDHSREILTATAALALCVLLPSERAQAQALKDAPARDALHQLNDAIETLVQRVSPSVVQIAVTGYASASEGERKQTNDIMGRRQSVGSGVIVDPDGYIVTNAHVVNGAQKIEVIVPPQSIPGAPTGMEQSTQGRSYEAHIIGITQQIDLAVIKIDASALPALSIKGSRRATRQGEMVFAFGSPEGLRNTVTMGVVSAVARQPDPDSPLFYVQTDTPINPGNSGGPLVDADGDLVGINTFIISSSGGNQGLGFAIPASVVAYSYPQLLKYGHLHEPSIGVFLQTITPDLASGLHLARDFGVIVSDVVPGGSAESADLRSQDIIVSVDDMPIASLPQFTHSLYQHQSGERIKVEVLRGSSRLSLDIPLVDRPRKEESLGDLADPTKNLVRSLSILGVELDFDLVRTLPALRIPSGVVVAARTLGSATGQVPLQTGDIIHRVNGTMIITLDELRAAMAARQPGDAVVLQIERNGQLMYVTFSL